MSELYTMLSANMSSFPPLTHQGWQVSFEWIVLTTGVNSFVYQIKLEGNNCGEAEIVILNKRENRNKYPVKDTLSKLKLIYSKIKIHLKVWILVLKRAFYFIRLKCRKLQIC